MSGYMKLITVEIDKSKVRLFHIPNTLDGFLFEFGYDGKNPYILEIGLNIMDEIRAKKGKTN